MADFTARSKPRARKMHFCDDCHRPISPGELYHRAAGSWDGRMGVWKECTHCAALIAMFQIEGWDDYAPGPDDISEWEPDTLPGLRAKVHWHKQWRRPDGSLYPIPGEVTHD